MTFAEALIRGHRDVNQRIGHDLRSLDTSLKRAGEDSTNRQTSEAFGQIRSLATPDVVKANALGPPRQCPVGVG